MRIAIHKTKGGFDSRWIEYCEKNDIEYKIVDCYANDIMAQTADCDALMWHHNHMKYQDLKFAKPLLFSLEQAGKKVFPNFNTNWHFDDKVGQKYLLEAVNAPLVPSYVFYTAEDAFKWIETTTFPKVFKLRAGAGSWNVHLAKNKTEAIKFTKRAFGRGFPQYSRFDNLKERWRKYRLGKTSIIDVLKGVVRIFHTIDLARMVGNEKGYIYFQEFIPENKFDIRIVVIAEKALGLKRMCRKNDFRASGGGDIIYEKTQIDEKCVTIALETSKKIGSQCLAYDFVFDKSGNPMIIEISYGFVHSAYDKCEGYWDAQMNWYEGSFNPYGWMVDEIMK